MISAPAAAPEAPDPSLPRAAATFTLGAIVGILIILHTPYLNGPPFFPWPWRVVPPQDMYPPLALAAVPFFVAQWLYTRCRRTVAALSMVMLACFALKLASVLPLTRPPSLEMIRITVEDPDTTSYYTDAAALSSQHASPLEWLPLYPQYMPILSLHSQTKAPGPILYWASIIKLLGFGRSAALAGGIGLGILATLSIVATYLLLRTLTRSSDAAFHGASFLAMAPGFVLFFPMFDAVYPILSCALVGFWVKAMESDDWRWSAALGAALMAVCLISFNVLVIGAFMALYPLVVPGQPIRRHIVVAAKHAAIALAIGLALVLALRPAIGYDAFATFASAWRNQHRLLALHAESRPYPQTIPFDLSDFALGSGWVSVALVGFYFASGARAAPRLRRLAILCIAQLVIVAVTGLLQSETARVWTFLLPLLLVPIGLELHTWSIRARLLAYVALWWVLATSAQNIRFLQ